MGSSASEVEAEEEKEKEEEKVIFGSVQRATGSAGPVQLLRLYHLMSGHHFLADHPIASYIIIYNTKINCENAS
jgi:hypothetical protein